MDTIGEGRNSAAGPHAQSYGPLRLFPFLLILRFNVHAVDSVASHFLPNTNTFFISLGTARCCECHGSLVGDFSPGLLREPVLMGTRVAFCCLCV
jgi:hypothetical protein